jgi:hypothetical protein
MFLDMILSGLKSLERIFKKFTDTCKSILDVLHGHFKPARESTSLFLKSGGFLIGAYNVGRQKYPLFLDMVFHAPGEIL